MGDSNKRAIPVCPALSWLTTCHGSFRVSGTRRGQNNYRAGGKYNKTRKLAHCPVTASTQTKTVCPSAHPLLPLCQTWENLDMQGVGAGRASIHSRKGSLLQHTGESSPKDGGVAPGRKPGVRWGIRAFETGRTINPAWLENRK